MRIPFIGPHNTESSVNVDYQLTQNWYPHIADFSKNKLVLYPTPGLTEFTNVGLGPIRGFVQVGDYIYVVSGSELYRVSTGGTGLLLGSILSSINPVSMCHNGDVSGNQILIADGVRSYIYDITYNSLFAAFASIDGSATSTTANKLVDSGASFIVDGVAKGMAIKNLTTGFIAHVSNVDSATTLSVTQDIFTSGDDYSINGGGLPEACTTVEYFEGYFLANDPTVAGRFFYSEGLYTDGTTEWNEGAYWDPLQSSSASSNSDTLVKIKALNKELWLIGERSTEIWYNSGAAEDPIVPITNASTEFGCAAANSVAKAEGALFWVSKNEQGQGQIIMTQGLSARVISTQAISSEISSMSSISDAIGYVYQYAGHVFYVITFPTGNRTFVYDLTTGMWHRWASFELEVHRCITYTFFDDRHIVGDAIDGRLYELDWSNYTEDGDTITRIRRSAHIHNDDRFLFHHSFELEFEAGVGDVTTPDPQIVLRWSDDGGHSWTDEAWRSMGLGSAGEYNKRAVWRKLGRSRDRIYEIKITDPIKAVITGGYINATPSDMETYN